MKPETQYPLPAKQYRRYAIFWSILMLGTLVGALALILWQARAALNWREILVVLLLLVQMGSYGVLIGQTPFPSQRRLIAYFAVNLGIWLVEYWLVPEIWWIVFAYIGQMFGMLPARIALPTALGVSVIVFGKNIGWDLRQVNRALLFAMIAQWGFLIVFMMFVSHLIQASRERGRLIAELEAAKEALEAAQQRETELAVLRERERLARDLHDSLGHALVALSVQLEAIQRLYRVDPERASAQIDELKALTRASMDALRRSVAGLRAPGLGDTALRPALQALCVELGQRIGIEVDCQIEERADELSLALAETIWRVAQEALTNVEKHAQAHRVQVVLQCEPGFATLCIADDGIGLPERAESTPTHFGLRGMRERVEGLGGTLMLSRDGNGTVIKARLPVIASGGQPASAGGEMPGER
ncbi:MAG: sensor histidine kinase [Anaerolineae bacterium]|nr:sensor histidine kinase [Anaerolineae bacterium]